MVFLVLLTCPGSEPSSLYEEWVLTSMATFVTLKNVCHSLFYFDEENKKIVKRCILLLLARSSFFSFLGQFGLKLEIKKYFWCQHDSQADVIFHLVSGNTNPCLKMTKDRSCTTCTNGRNLPALRTPFMIGLWPPLFLVLFLLNVWPFFFKYLFPLKVWPAGPPLASPPSAPLSLTSLARVR